VLAGIDEALRTVHGCVVRKPWLALVVSILFGITAAHAAAATIVDDDVASVSFASLDDDAVPCTIVSLGAPRVMVAIVATIAPRSLASNVPVIAIAPKTSPPRRARSVCSRRVHPWRR
jgi:hypothetical protein